jgi:hypothetical protein
MDNIAGANGGAINFFTGSHDSEIENCKFINNAAYDAGALLWNGINGRVIDSEFINNRVKLKFSYSIYFITYEIN